eukprot:3287509-Ditylum_brightwellii.AAC.1
MTTTYITEDLGVLGGVHKWTDQLDFNLSDKGACQRGIWEAQYDGGESRNQTSGMLVEDMGNPQLLA